jgi:hypothetical protein
VQIVTRATIGTLVTISALVATLVTTAGCGDLARTGRSPAFIIIESLTAASGADPGTFASTLNSDVETFVDDVPTIFNDLGQAALRLQLKDPGTSLSPTSPSPLNQITINRFRVEFRRADGRNTPGVDVPFGFDGAATATLSETSATTIGFQIVSHAMKLEPPLASLVGGGGQVFIHTIAEITFFGRDQTGNEVSASGMISVNFGDFADPD